MEMWDIVQKLALCRFDFFFFGPHSFFLAHARVSALAMFVATERGNLGEKRRAKMNVAFKS